MTSMYQDGQVQVGQHKQQKDDWML